MFAVLLTMNWKESEPMEKNWNFGYAMATLKQLKRKYCTNTFSLKNSVRAGRTQIGGSVGSQTTGYNQIIINRAVHVNVQAPLHIT